MNGFRPSLFYLLYNYRLVSPVRLLAALHYQHEQDWKSATSFVSILKEFCGLEPRMLSQLQERFGDLELEPLPQLLLDARHINEYQFFKLQGLRYYFPSTYVGKLLIEQGILDQDGLNNFLSTGPVGFNLYDEARTPMQQRQAMMLLYERLLLREYLSREEMTALGIHRLEHLSISFKPLVDVLIMHGDVPVDLLGILQPQAVPREIDPLLPLLACSGFSEPSLLAGIRRNTQKDLERTTEWGTDLNLACELVDKGLISPHRLKSAVLESYRALISSRKTSGTAQAASGEVA